MGEIETNLGNYLQLQAPMIKSEQVLKNGMANGIHSTGKVLISQSAPVVKSAPFSTPEDDPSLAWKKDGNVYNKGTSLIHSSAHLSHFFVSRCEEAWFLD